MQYHSKSTNMQQELVSQEEGILERIKKDFCVCKVLSRALKVHSILCKAHMNKNSRYFFTNISHITAGLL